jgi:hypothetical protein
MQSITLKVFLATKDMTLNDFCKELGCNPSYMSSVMRGNRYAGHRLAKDVNHYTNGQVKLKTRRREKDMESQSQEGKDEHQQKEVRIS